LLLFDLTSLLYRPAKKIGSASQPVVNVRGDLFSLVPADLHKFHTGQIIVRAFVDWPGVVPGCPPDLTAGGNAQKPPGRAL
jgi:hypothetical protein